MADSEPNQHEQSVDAVAGTVGASGSYSNSAITLLRAGEPLPTSRDEQILAAKISRAMLSGPFHITRDATVADMDAQGNVVVLRQGTNQWVCFPGDENEIGNVPMCADPMGLQWMRDIMAGKPAPMNTAPGIIYMLCGATQHSNTDPFDRSSPPVVEPPIPSLVGDVQPAVTDEGQQHLAGPDRILEDPDKIVARVDGVDILENLLAAQVRAQAVV
jgi:hypothetical protein